MTTNKKPSHIAHRKLWKSGFYKLKESQADDGGRRQWKLNRQGYAQRQKKPSRLHRNEWYRIEQSGEANKKVTAPLCVDEFTQSSVTSAKNVAIAICR